MLKHKITEYLIKENKLHKLKLKFKKKIKELNL